MKTSQSVKTLLAALFLTACSQSPKYVDVEPIEAVDPCAATDACIHEKAFMQLDADDDMSINIKKELKGKHKSLIKADTNKDGKIGIIEYMNHVDPQMKGR